jgi:GTP1/Obg family GTP-binding protein
MHLELRQRWFQAGLLIILSALAAGCIHLAPQPYLGQREEARALGKIFKTLTPAAREEVVKEQKIARELRVTLDEVATMPAPGFTERFNYYVEQLTALQRQRRELQQALSSRQWHSRMVLAVQQGAVEQLQQDLTRNQKWIELAEGVRLRMELGRVGGYPELVTLSHQLDIFLAARSDLDPFADRIRALQDAFRLTETDFD